MKRSIQRILATQIARRRVKAGFSGLPVLALIAAITLSVAAQPVVGQDDDKELPDGVVPPPLNVISDEEKEELEAQTKIKDRTKLALEMMEGRLARSEMLAGKQDFEGSLRELGGFQALVRNTFNYLKQNEYQKASLKNFKRLEIALREFIPRLGVIRKEMPYRYSFHVRQMIIFVRDARGDALEPLFDDTVLPNNEDGV